MSPLILPESVTLKHTAYSLHSFSIYLSKNTQLSFLGKIVHIYPGLRKLTRDDPDIIKARLVAVDIS